MFTSACRITFSVNSLVSQCGMRDDHAFNKFVTEKKLLGRSNATSVSCKVVCFGSVYKTWELSLYVSLSIRCAQEHYVKRFVTVILIKCIALPF